MYVSEHWLGKDKVEVQAELDDGVRLLGFLFVKQGQRISDLLNDERGFLPLLTTDGLIVLLKKTAIARVTQLDQAAECAALTDPYEILGVWPRIDDAALRKAYHALCAQHHPDKLVSLGLAGAYVDMANSRLARVIDAYHRVQKLRQAAAAEAAKAATAAEAEAAETAETRAAKAAEAEAAETAETRAAEAAKAAAAKTTEAQQPEPMFRAL